MSQTHDPQPLPWYGENGFVIPMLICIPPVGLPLMWIHSRWADWIKVLVTLWGIFSFLFLLLIIVLSAGLVAQNSPSARNARLRAYAEANATPQAQVSPQVQIEMTTPAVTEFIDSYELRVGERYRTTKQVPLMPEFEPADPLAAMSNVRGMPPGTKIKILEVRFKGDAPWYRVSASGPFSGTGWINCVALINGLEK